MKMQLMMAAVVMALTGVPLHAEEHAPKQAVDMEAGEAKAKQVCMACHGPQGNSIVPIWPKLAGQHPDYIYKQLMEFKGGGRVNAQMSPMAAPLTEDEMRNVAAYYSSQTQTAGTTAPEQAELGQRIFQGGNPDTGVPACSGCHGPTGEGLNLAKFPRIAGQHADYLVQTLKDFRAAARANDPNAMMRGSAARLTDDEITAVAQYLQGLSQGLN